MMKETFFTEVIDEELMKAEGRMLRRLGFDSGDIRPLMAHKLNTEANKYKKALLKWFKRRAEEKNRLEIHFSDLDSEAKQKYLNFYNLESEEEVMGTAPIQILEK